MESVSWAGVEPTREACAIVVHLNTNGLNHFVAGGVGRIGEHHLRDEHTVCHKLTFDYSLDTAAQVDGNGYGRKLHGGLLGFRIARAAELGICRGGQQEGGQYQKDFFHNKTGFFYFQMQR